MIDAKTKSMILSAMDRLVWQRFQPKNDVLSRCKVKVAIGEFKNGNVKNKVMYCCEHCKQTVEKIQVDHIEPRIEVGVGFVDFNTYIARTFVQADKLQGLCVDCHTVKTQAENARRRSARK